MKPKIEGIEYRKVNEVVQKSEPYHVELIMVDDFINHNADQLVSVGSIPHKIKALWNSWITILH